MKIDWNQVLSPLKIAELTYGNDASRFNGLEQVVKELNEVSSRWIKFIQENFVPKTEEDKMRRKALDALKCVIEDIEMLQDGRWSEITDDSCEATLDNLVIIMNYLESQMKK